MDWTSQNQYSKHLFSLLFLRFEHREIPSHRAAEGGDPVPEVEEQRAEQPELPSADSSDFQFQPAVLVLLDQPLSRLAPKTLRPLQRDPAPHGPKKEKP